MKTENKANGLEINPSQIDVHTGIVFFVTINRIVEMIKIAILAFKRIYNKGYNSAHNCISTL